MKKILSLLVVLTLLFTPMKGFCQDGDGDGDAEQPQKKRTIGGTLLGGTLGLFAGIFAGGYVGTVGLLLLISQRRNPKVKAMIICRWLSPFLGTLCGLAAGHMQGAELKVCLWAQAQAQS
ncbi:MAG: hypothetical protein LBT58_02265 [Endomicrobium sp.]|jgi:hypothetical protein|nr:hypothetical protein [Endomicrobium sp.]